jgi:hypothetical protein
MDRSRKATRDGNEATLQHASEAEKFRIEEITEDNLAQLQVSMEALKQTPAGKAELQRRVKAFGECKRTDEETSRQFFDKLRRWLEREIPQTKFPLHPPRQVRVDDKGNTPPIRLKKGPAMATKAGVWIDHKQAIVVLITDAGQEIKKIALEVGQPALPSKSAGGKHKYTPNDFIAEDKLQRKVEADRESYYESVMACVQGADALLILGPGEAKGEFSKHVKAKKFRGVVELETTDKLTDRQLAAKVKQHFATSAAKPAVAPKKNTAPKKTAKKAAPAAPVKRPKKSGK